MTESWRPVVGYEGFYEVSDHGRVRSVDRVVEQRNGKALRLAGHPLAAGLDGKGYPNVGLRRPGHRRTARVHDLVLRAFAGPPPSGLEGCHRDGNPLNNNWPSNLEWGTPSSNGHDRVRHGTHPQAARTACPLQHRLITPNLEPNQLRRGRRSCYACHLTRSGPARAAKRAGRAFDFRWEADRRYRQIMSETTN